MRSIYMGSIYMKTTLMRKKIKEYLSDGPKTTAQIISHLNKVLKHGTTRSAVNNVLGKSREFTQVGTTYKQNLCHARYPIAIWKLTPSHQVSS
jgi:hypothetical protein